MYFEEQRTRRVFGSDSTMGLFVALYLILLAFFIVLTSVSEQSIDRAVEAMTSVNTTFDDRAAVTEDRGDTSLESAASDPVLIAVERALASEFDIDASIASYRGNILQIQVPAAYFFEPGSFRVRSSTHPVLERVLAAMHGAPTGWRQEMVLLFGSGTGPVDREMTRSQEVAVRRAGAFARYMEEQGFLDFSTGFATIPTDQVMLIFRNRRSNGRAALDVGRRAS